MSAAHRRQALARTGRDLLARHGGPGQRRGAQLLRTLAGRAPDVIGLADLDRVPLWLRLPRAALEAVAQRAALLSMAPALAETIDGDLLGTHARIAGDDAVEWAIERAPRVAEGGLPPVAADRLAARGFALMRAALPDRIEHLVDPADEPGDLPPRLAAYCVTEAFEGARAA